MKKEIAPRVVLDDKVRSGKLLIKGTRVPVEAVAQKVAAGKSFGEVAKAYGITRADVLAASTFVARKPAGEPGDASE
jgi:uncharacterized protein (DUF433 family)